MQAFPLKIWFRLSRWFQEAYHSVGLRVATEALGAVAARVHAGDFQIGVTGPEGWNRKHFQTQAAKRVRLVPVVAANHALASLKGPIADADIQGETQLVLSERSDATRGVDFGVLSHRVWRVADLWTKLAFLRAGLGWGTMPEHMVEQDMTSGILKVLRPKAWEGHEWCLPLFAITDRTAVPLGPAGKALLERMTSA